MKKIDMLFTMMKSGKKVPVEDMINALAVSQGSVMCLISALRNDFGAEIETERDGRKVISYQLTNPSAVKLPVKETAVAKKNKAKPSAKKFAVTKTKFASTKKNTVSGGEESDGSVAILDNEDYDSYSSETATLRAELGLVDSYSE